MPKKAMKGHFIYFTCEICTSVLFFAFLFLHFHWTYAIFLLVPLVLFCRSKLTVISGLGPFLDLCCEHSKLLLPGQREKKEAYKRGTRKAGSRGWRTKDLSLGHGVERSAAVWRAGFHFSLIQCEVFKTHKCGFGR